MDEVGAVPPIAIIKINVLLDNLSIMQSGFKGRQSCRGGRRNRRGRSSTRGDRHLNKRTN